MEKEPEFNDAWVLLCFAAGFVLALPLGYIATESTAPHYWREFMGMPLGAGFVAAFASGLMRLAGWFAMFGMLGLAQLFPLEQSWAVGCCLMLISYFSLFFAAGSRLTLRKVLIITGCNTALLLLSHCLDVSQGEKGLGLVPAVLALLAITVGVVVVNGLNRLARRLLG